MFGGYPYGGGAFGGGLAEDIPSQAYPSLAVEVAFTTGALETPVWVDVTQDVRQWDSTRGRNRELERFQPGRATVVLDNRLRKYDSSVGDQALYIDLPGSSGNYVSTPDSTAVSVTGDIDIRVRVALDDWTPAGFTSLVSKRGAAGQRSWRLGLNADGSPGLMISADGTTEVFSGSGVFGFSGGTTHWIRWTWVDSTNAWIVYKSDDDTNDPDAVAWTTHNTGTLASAGIFDSTTPITVGSDATLGSPLAGNVFYAEVRNGIGGPVVAKFDPNDVTTVPTIGSRSPSSWTSTSGEVWTVNGSAWAWGGEWGSPYSGNLRPMRRIRIRETFDGVTYPVFDGFVDRWVLDYPLTGKDATATVVATDAKKIFARTDLPRSVYTTTVDDDLPLIWWRLDETLGVAQQGFAVNAGTGGSTYDGTFVASPPVGRQGLIANDPSTSMDVFGTNFSEGAVLQGAKIANAAFSLLSNSVFSVEAWGRPQEADAAEQGNLWCVSRSADSSSHAVCGQSGDRFVFAIADSAFANTYGVMTPVGSVVPNTINHLVSVLESGGQMALYLNGTRYTTTLTGAASSVFPGSPPTNGDFCVGHTQRDSGGSLPAHNWTGSIDEVAVYTSALSETRVDAHYVAGTSPWHGDLPGARLERILDLVGWPDSLRAIDDGATTLQSAALGVTALEHMHKVAESEYGLLFVARDGNVRFIDRANVFVRVAYPVTFGDDSGEIGYRDIKFDDGDTVIRNRATISRLNGVAKTEEDTTSVDEFGRFDYTLDGLLHSSDSHSADYAEFIVAEYKDPRRRVVLLSLGPASAAEATALYPGVLGRELGDVVLVQNNPPGGGAEFSQECVIEGIHRAGTPKRSTARFVLSPAPTNDF